MQKLSDTRWACRYSACKAIRDTLQAICLLLDEMSTSKNAQRAVEARSLISAIDANFVITLELLCDILGRTQSLSCMLQSATADLAKAVDLIDIAVQDLANDRLTDKHFDEVWTAAERSYYVRCRGLILFTHLLVLNLLMVQVQQGAAIQDACDALRDACRILLYLKQLETVSLLIVRRRTKIVCHGYYAG